MLLKRRHVFLLYDNSEKVVVAGLVKVKNENSLNNYFASKVF
jgi:hypothetical protein